MIMLAKIAFKLDSELPRDQMTINPCYFGDDPVALANALLVNLKAIPQIATTTPMIIRIYNAQKEPPSYPLAEAKQDVPAPASSVPREVSLCLSYYSTYNRPGYRGRVYIPGTFVGGSVGLKPTSTQMNNALGWTNALGKGLPSGHNLVVYSRKQDASYGVSNTFVDNEWDTVRSRGLKPDARVVSTLP